jgi:hypothetical protein
VPDAVLLHHSKRITDHGAIADIKLWLVPAPVRGSRHSLKYSLFHGRRGQRLVAYDNEAGKGDHRHLADTEHPYAFTTPDQLVADFLADVARLRDGRL